jgi:hypothetical protein
MSRIPVTYGPAPEPMRVTNVAPGDEWTSDKETVIIDVIEGRPADENFPNGAVRVSGRIIRGHGASQRTRYWTFQPDQELQIVRRP